VVAPHPHTKGLVHRAPAATGARTFLTRTQSAEFLTTSTDSNPTGCRSQKLTSDSTPLVLLNLKPAAVLRILFSSKPARLSPSRHLRIGRSKVGRARAVTRSAGTFRPPPSPRRRRRAGTGARRYRRSSGSRHDRGGGQAKIWRRPGPTDGGADVVGHGALLRRKAAAAFASVIGSQRIYTSLHTESLPCFCDSRCVATPTPDDDILDFGERAYSTLRVSSRHCLLLTLPKKALCRQWREM
jgi:hypothetical protein